MPSIDVLAPVSSAPADRLALGVRWVRPGAGGLGGNLNPANLAGPYSRCTLCFAGTEE